MLRWLRLLIKLSLLHLVGCLYYYGSKCSPSYHGRFTSREVPGIKWIRGQMDPQRWSGPFRDEKSLLPLPRIQTPFLCCETTSLVTTLTELSRLLYWFPRDNFSTRANAEQKPWTFIIIIFPAVWNKNKINIRVNFLSKICKQLKSLAQRRFGRTGRRLRFVARHARLYLTSSLTPSPTVVINSNYKNPIYLL